MTSIGSALPPWQMWGTTATVTVPPGPTTQPVTTQLARVNYGRPESWGFFVAAEIVSGIAQGLDFTCFVDFFVIIGVGRSQFSMQAPLVGGIPTQESFVRFGFTIPTGVGPTQQNSKKWTTRVRVPALDDTLAPVAQYRPEMDSFVAQDIQCSAQVRPSLVTSPIGIAVTSYFCPRHHLRPDWFLSTASNDARFRGDELGGT